MDQPKKYRIVLKPLSVVHDNRGDESQIKGLQDTIAYYEQEVQKGRTHYAPFITRYKAKLAKLQSRPDTERVIEADHIGYADEATMLAGIGPGNFPFQTRCIGASSGHAERLYKKRHNPDFYSVGHSPTGIWPDDPSHSDYVVTRKFKKILSINIDNVISINGKPIIGRLDNLDKGVSHLDEWSIDSISDLLED